MVMNNRVQCFVYRFQLGRGDLIQVMRKWGKAVLPVAELVMLRKKTEILICGWVTQCYARPIT